MLRHRVVPSAYARHRNSGDRHGLRANILSRQRARCRPADCNRVPIARVRLPVAARPHGRRFRHLERRRPAQLRRRRAIIDRGGRRDTQHRQRLGRDRRRQSGLLRGRVGAIAGPGHRHAGDRHCLRADILQSQGACGRPAGSHRIHRVRLAVAGAPGPGRFRCRKLRRPAQLRRRRPVIDRGRRRDT